MRINIVMSYAIPMSPNEGGAMEKSWYALAREFSKHGHKVTIISRAQPGCPPSETNGSLTHIRLRGHRVTRSRLADLCRDFSWSIRVRFHLPAADITVVTSRVLPFLLRPERQRIGKIVLCPSPGMLRWLKFYSKVDCVLAPRSAAKALESLSLRKKHPLIQFIWHPLTGQGSVSGADRPGLEKTTIGYFGRLHRDRGLDTLISALELIKQQTPKSSFKVLLCGPSDICAGGSGAAYCIHLERRLAKFLAPDDYSIRNMNLDRVPSVVRTLDILCQPCAAIGDDWFASSLIEAMAAGAVPVVPKHPFFEGLVADGQTGVSFNHEADDALEQLSAQLRGLLENSTHREALSQGARDAAFRVGLPACTSRLLADFATIALSP